MNINQASFKPEEINPIITEVPWGVHSLERTNLSSSNLIEQTNSTTSVTEVPLGVITSIYSVLPRQSEKKDDTVPSSSKSLVVRSEEAWRTHQYIDGSQHSLHSDEPRASGRTQPPYQESFARPGVLTIGEEVQVEYEQQEYSTIAVPQPPAEKTTISSGPITTGEEIQLKYEPAYSSIAVSQLPTERSTASPGKLIIDEEIQIQYDQEYPTIAVPQLQENNTNTGPETLTIGGDVQHQQEYPTIEVPLITNSNISPELVTFRSGVYVGDAIPPVYSNLRITATTDDYEPPVPVMVQPNMSIFRVPISQVQLMTEPVPNSINQEQWTESNLNANTLDVDGSQALPQVGENMVEQEQLITSGSYSTSGGRSIDGRTLVTLRDKRLILIYKGYHFSRYYCQGLKIRWRCVNQRCDAYLYSIANKITVTHPIHNHLTVIGQNSYVPNSATEPYAVYSLEEAISAMTDPISSFNQGTDPNTLRAADTDMMTLSYNHESTSIDITKQTTSSVVNTSSNFESSVGHDVLAAANTFIPQDPHVVLAVANTFIPHDPSLEITVKSTSEETTNDDLVISPLTTITSLPNPMALCVASYTPNSPNDYAANADTIFNPNFNYMSVPKDVSVKVTLTSVPKNCEPQVYYDGKLAQSSVKRNIHTSAKREMARGLVLPNDPTTSNREMTLKIPKATIASTEVSVSTPTTSYYTTAADASTLTYYAASDPTTPKRDCGKPNINILRSQIVSGSDPHYSHLFNALTPRAQTLAPYPQIRFRGATNVIQGNSTVPSISTQTPSTFRSFIHNSPNSSMSMQSAQNTLIYGTSRSSNYPHIVQRASSRISILADEQVDFSNRRTTRATTRARIIQSRQQNQ